MPSVPEFRKNTHLLVDLLAYMKREKKWWLTPIILVLLLLGGLLILGGSSFAPFIYTLF